MEYIRKNKFLFLLIIILICLIFCLLNKDSEIVYEEPTVELFDNNIGQLEEIEENDVVEIKSVFVDVKGAVKKPGVYELLETARVIDVIDLSGGLLENADTSNINLSKKLKDEMVIIVDFKKEIIKEECNCSVVEDNKQQTDNLIDSNEKIEDTKNEEIGNDILIEEKEEIQNDASLDSETNDKVENNEVNSNTKISLNTATKEQLMTLPGIGESKALAIIEYRNNTLFKSIEEITNIKGIGNSIYEKLKEYITT